MFVLGWFVIFLGYGLCGNSVLGGGFLFWRYWLGRFCNCVCLDVLCDIGNCLGCGCFRYWLGWRLVVNLLEWLDVVLKVVVRCDSGCWLWIGWWCWWVVMVLRCCCRLVYSDWRLCCWFWFVVVLVKNWCSVLYCCCCFFCLVCVRVWVWCVVWFVCFWLYSCWFWGSGILCVVWIIWYVWDSWFCLCWLLCW